MGVDSLSTLIHFFVMMMIIVFYMKLEKKSSTTKISKTENKEKK